MLQSGAIRLKTAIRFSDTRIASHTVWLTTKFSTMTHVKGTL